MSEKFQSSIERRNKRFSVEMGRSALLFEYTNTVIYEHPEQYKCFDNVTVTSGEGDEVSMTAYFRDDSPELYKTLYENDFPRVFMPYPSLSDEACWLKGRDAELARDIADFEERGELY